jgi:hypothetical protein
MTTYNENEKNELPPFFKTWKQLYTFVLLELLACLLLFYTITTYFAK